MQSIICRIKPGSQGLQSPRPNSAGRQRKICNARWFQCISKLYTNVMCSCVQCWRSLQHSGASALGEGSQSCQRGPCPVLVYLSKLQKKYLSKLLNVFFQIAKFISISWEGLLSVGIQLCQRGLCPHQRVNLLHAFMLTRISSGPGWLSGLC